MAKPTFGMIESTSVPGDFLCLHDGLKTGRRNQCTGATDQCEVTVFHFCGAMENISALPFLSSED